MANSAQAKKRARQAVKRRAHNMASRSMMRTAIKKVRAALQGNDAEQARTAFNAAQATIDKLARKGLIHKNAAARYKSRINAQIKNIAA